MGILVVRHLLPPPPSIGARLQPQHLHWQVGRYRERLTSGPGGLGRGRLWVPEREAEQHNLILDAAYDLLIGQHGFLNLHSYAAVGTGSTPPASTQTALVGEVGRTRRDENGDATGTRTAVYTGTPGVYDIQVVREFSESEVGGRNFTEWGFSPLSNANGTLMCRELFRDGLGNPIVLTLATDQRLRLIYKIRVTIAPISQAVSLNISGLGTFTGTFRFYRRSRGTSSTVGGDLNDTDLTLVDAIARGGASIYLSGSSTITLSMGFRWMSQVQHTSYDPGNVYAQGSTRGGPKAPTYGSVSGRSRPVLAQVWASSEANANDLWSYGWAASPSGYTPGALAFISFDSPLAKSNLYKLQIDPWTLSWGP